MNFSKTSAAIISVLFVLTVLFPVRENWRSRPSDDFPLSYYPMFSKKRGDAYTMHYFIGVDDGGNRHLLSYRLVGTGGFNQTRRQINRSIRKGRAKKLVKTVAKRVARRSSHPYSKIEKVYLMRGTFDFDRYFLQDDKSPRDEYPLAKRTVQR